MTFNINNQHFLSHSWTVLQKASFLWLIGDTDLDLVWTKYWSSSCTLNTDFVT